jgi:(p)ppGpp synthase/HD superfamily hydrolase
MSIDNAIAFAALAHAGQKRKYDGDPYIVHPIYVMKLVRKFEPANDDMAIAAVLHDVLEDTPVGEPEIERRFGSNVLRLVTGMTKVKVPGNRAANKAAERIRLAAEDGDVQTIKCCDIAANGPSIIKNDPGFAKVWVPEAEQLLSVMTKANPQAHLRARIMLKL